MKSADDEFVSSIASNVLTAQLDALAAELDAEVLNRRKLSRAGVWGLVPTVREHEDMPDGKLWCKKHGRFSLPQEGKEVQIFGVEFEVWRASCPLGKSPLILYLLVAGLLGL